MKRFFVAVALCLATTHAQAFGLPYAVESLEKAQASVAKDKSRHVLVFYTSEA